MAIPTGFVRWSTAESRAAGRISILAIAETLFAVALYWWIAIRFDTHIHLVTSLFVAPLLLLRSERSIAAGVDWFQRDWFGFEHYAEWPRARKGVWLVILALTSFAVSWWVSSYLAQAWLVDQTGPMLFLSAALIGMIGVLLGLMVAMAMAMAVAVAVAVAAGAGAGAAMAAVAVAVAMAMVVAGAMVGAMVVAVAGFTVRAMLVRLMATLRFLAPDGIRSLPANWRENNFVIDSLTPAELVPGIGEHNETFTLKGMIKEFKEAEDRKWEIVWFLIILVWFLPVLLYRLNIKATCWFYWPLVFLLRPLPDDDRMERRRHDLCWPWTNPAQLLLILAGLPWFVGSLVDIESLLRLPDWPAVAFWLEYVLILDWSALEVWHWVNLVIAVTGALMLFIAGSAVASYRAGLDYGEEKSWSLPVMHGLWRLRTLAVIAGLLLALGSVLVHLQPEWLAVLLGPQAQALRDFYGY
ncbi:hypothetical protein [Candidatus Thiosymbion oneisti]|uniref:hypothetical protein n=1 Tax=Candidatus Thiosymbion oneisti TaxID=589554 RepID=UPI000A984D0D|nr:hypothetical protein [Candidatus Thiosymbion oneisti]